MRPQLQGAIVAVLEEGLAVNTQEFFDLLSGDPALVLSHWSGGRYFHTIPRVKDLSIGLSKVLSLCFSRETVWAN